MKSITIILLIYLIVPIEPNLNENLNYDDAKKIKIKLIDKTKFKEYIIKVDSLNVYSVAKKEMIQYAINNDCENCRIIPINQIKKIKPSKSLRSLLGFIIGGAGLILGFIASSWLNDTLEGGFPILSQFALTLILGGIFFGVGSLIGSNLDHLNPKQKQEKEINYLRDNSIISQYYKIE